MARFDVYLNSGKHAENTPYLLDVQSDLLGILESRMVIPLRVIHAYDGVKIPTRLTPVLQVNGLACLLETPKMAAVPRRILKRCVASLVSEQDQIVGALDFLFNGY